MPRKTRTPESLALNRENQRRSRARQRELLDDLQGRVREYERRDGQATLEMQRVARAVAGENAALRGLLAAKGVPAEEVEAHVEAVKYDERMAGRTGVQSVTPGSTPSCASPVAIASRHVVYSQTQGCGIKENSNLPSTFQPGIYSPPTPTTTVTSCTEESGCCPRPQPPPQSQSQSQYQPQPEAQQTKTLDKIHCMEAATILAQIRGQTDISQARASLGCETNDNCMIQNTDLLNMMDQMT